MPDSLIAVPEGPYRFDAETVTRALAAVWRETSFARATGRIAALSAGQISVEVDGVPVALVEVDVDGLSLGVDWTSMEVLATLVSVVTAVPGFPGDGTVILSDWAPDVVPLTPHMSPDEVSALRD